MKTRVMVVDEDETSRTHLRARLEREGHEVLAASSADEAMSSFTKGPEAAVLITDLLKSGGSGSTFKDGFALMAWAKEHYPQLQVIVMTAHGNKETAIKSLRSGAADYFEKPLNLDELSQAVKRGVHQHQLERDGRDRLGRLEARVERVEGKAEDNFWYVSKSQAMGRVNEWLTILRREAMRGGAEEPTVLILGESGTGKEGVARMVHAGSRRGKGPWVAVNCANFPEALLESELFGHERGAFSGAQATQRGLFEIAQGGTLFLDEIGEMDVKLQAKLLRALQEKTFRRMGGTQDLETDVRLVAATHRDLRSKVTSGKFREDLYHRLSRVVVEIPSLRERSEDVIPMASQFAERAFRARAKAFPGFAPDAEKALHDYFWPGNVRELLNVIERTALLWEGSGPVGAKSLGMPLPTTPLSGGPKLELVSSPLELPEGGNAETEPGYAELKKRWVDSFEREFLTAALNRSGGNVSAAARSAKLDRSNFLRLLRRHGLKSQEYRKAA